VRVERCVRPRDGLLPRWNRRWRRSINWLHAADTGVRVMQVIGTTKQTKAAGRLATAGVAIRFCIEMIVSFAILRLAARRWRGLQACCASWPQM